MPLPWLEGVKPTSRLGKQSKLSKSTRDFIMQTFMALGGVEAMTEWARKYPCEFYNGLFKSIIPKSVIGELDVRQQLTGVTLNVMEVADPSAALNALELAERARVAHRAGGGAGDGDEVAIPLPSHESCVQQADAGGAGAGEEADSSDASTARQDDDDRKDSTVPLLHDVPEPGSDLRSTLSRLCGGTGRSTAAADPGTRSVLRVLGKR